MQRWLLLILGVIILYLVPSLLLQAVYGDSYGFMASEDCWIADGQGGWQMRGFPDSPRPDEPSQNVPVFLQIAPFILPLLLILLFLLSPLSSYMDREPKYDVSEFDPEKYYPEYDPDDSDN